MKRTICLVVLILTLCSSYGWAHNPIQTTLDHLQQALNENDFAALKPHLADEFSFNGYDGSMGLSIMTQIVDQYPRTIRSISVQSVIENDDRIILTTEIDLGDEVEIKEIVLDREFKILLAPIVEIQLGGHGGTGLANKAPKGTNQVKYPAVTEANFELVGRLIAVTAEVEGVRGNFMIDTGATGFIINSRLHPNLDDRAQPLDKASFGVNGKISNARKVTAKNFKWDALQAETIDGLYYDLSHLEESVGMELLGIIGADFLSQFTLQFDYKRKVMTLYSGDATKEWSTPPNQTIELDVLGHMPVFTAQFGEYSLRLAIDSGAEGGMIFKKWEDRLQKQYEVVGQESLNGADQVSSMATKVELTEFRVDGIFYRGHKFMLADLVFDHEVQIDGLVGYEFLSSYKTAIDIQGQKLYVWAEEG